MCDRSHSECELSLLHQIRDQVRLRAAEMESVQGNWPCRQGCDDCCRHLASEPRVSQEEWRQIAAALEKLPEETVRAARQRILDSAGKRRPVTCPLLHVDSGSCLVYEARPIACRAYGFYAERQNVLGCCRIEAIALQSPEVIWGNHVALDGQTARLGPAVELSAWLDSPAHPTASS